MDVDKIEQHVRRGALLLDHKKPGWAKLINTDRLEMQNPYKCVLGQLYNSFDTGARQIVHHVKKTEQENYYREILHGFNIYHGWFTEGQEVWHRLTNAWLAEIQQRLNHG